MERHMELQRQTMRTRLVKPFTRWAPFLLFLLGISACTAAGSPHLGEVVREIDLRIWCIHQDRRGDYWFGSNGNGLYRYDGRQIARYGRDDLGGVHVRDIQEDKAGNLFISTNAAVTKFDGVQFEKLELVDAPTDGSAWALEPDDVWLVFDPGRHGPCRYDGERLVHLELSRSPAEDAGSRTPGRRFTPTGVYSIYRDRRGHMWFGTAGVGVCRYDGQQLGWMYEERLTTTPNGGAFGIRSIYEDRSGDYWICNTRQRFEVAREVIEQNGHVILDYTKREGLPGAQPDGAPNFEYFPSITEDHDGALWMACGNAGVWKYGGDSVTKFAVGDAAYSIEVYCDRQGTLWAGTVDQGVYRFDGAKFEGFQPTRDARQSK